MKKEKKNLKAWLYYLMIIVVFIISVIYIYISNSQKNIDIDDAEDLNNQIKSQTSNVKDELIKKQSVQSVKSKKLNIYFFNKNKPITNSSIIISYKKLNQSYFDVCFYGACEIYASIFPINIIEAKEKNIMTDCAWKNQFEKHLQGRPFKIEYYDEYKKLIRSLADNAIKKIEFNPCIDNKNCPNIQDSGNYSFDISDENFKLIDLKKYPEFKERSEINNICYENDVFENWSK